MTSNEAVNELGSPYTEQLVYSNPHKRQVEPIWFQQERFFILNGDDEVIWKQAPEVPVKEYVFREGSPDNPGRRLKEQHPVYSLIPGSFHYQPVVEEVEVFVPGDYRPNTFRSEAAITKSVYPIVSTERYYVRPVI